MDTGREGNTHHSSRWAATFHLRLSWFNILISPVWCHKVDACVRVCAWVCLLQTVMEGKDEKLRSWRWRKDRTPGKQSDCGAWWMLLQLSFLYLLSFSPLLIFPPPEPPSISPNSLMASISEGAFACAHMHLRCFQMWFICSEQQLVLMWAAADWLFSWHRGGLMPMMAALLLPLITQSNREVSKTYAHHGLHLWKRVKNKNYTFGTY